MNLSIKAQTYLERGRELLDQDQPNQALEKFNQVLEIIPKHGCAYHLMGKALQRLGDQSAAESCQSLSCELDPSIGWNWYALGEYQQRRGELRDGIQSLMEASKWLPAERWLIDRAKRLKKQLIWNNVKSQKDAKPRFNLEALINGIWCIRPDIRIKLQGERE